MTAALLAPMLVAFVLTAGCVCRTGCRQMPQESPPIEESHSTAENAAWTMRRAEMVDVLKLYGVRDERVLAAMGRVRRHMFIPETHRSRDTAYGDHPCRIGSGQTISQPYIVAYMTEQLRIIPGERILEIGTGSGYQAAVLAEMGATVFSIEIIPALAAHAEQALKTEGYPGVRVLCGDGYKGWPEHAPFDAIIVTCSPEEIPDALVAQLREGGRMILPLDRSGDQRLIIVRKKDGKIEVQNDLPVRFVPMVRGVTS